MARDGQDQGSIRGESDALIAAFVAVAIIVAVKHLGDSLTALFGAVRRLNAKMPE